MLLGMRTWIEKNDRRIEPGVRSRALKDLPGLWTTDVCAAHHGGRRDLLQLPLRCGPYSTYPTAFLGIEIKLKAFG